MTTAAVTPLLDQIREQVRARGLSVRALAAALRVRAKVVKAWFDGTAHPSDDELDALLSLLGLVSVVVADPPEARTAGSIRRELSPQEQATYDAVPDSPQAVLALQVRDLQLQRVRLEQAYAIGSVTPQDYLKQVLLINEGLRRLTETLAKVKTMGLPDESVDGMGPVEVVFGSPRGDGYDEAAVRRMRLREAAIGTTKAVLSTARALVAAGNKKKRKADDAAAEGEAS